MLYNANYIKKTAIVKNIARTANLAGVVATKDNLADGEVVITNTSNVILDTTTVLNAKDIRIIQSLGNSLEPFTVDLSLNELIEYVGTPYEAAVEQVSYFGFNGTSGSIIAANNYAYNPSVAIRPNTMFLGNQNALFWYGPYTSGAGSTSKSVATGITKSFIANFSKQAAIDGFIKVERVADGAGTPIAVTVGVTKGSTTVTGTALGAAAPVGTVVRFGTVADLTNPVYIVAAASTNSITLDIPWQGETGSFTGTTALASTVGTNYGVKLTGQPEIFDINSFMQYDKIRFDLGGNVNGSAKTTTVAAKDGVGVYPLVAIDEDMSWGFEGQYYIDQIPPTFRFKTASPSGTFSSLSFGFKRTTNHTMTGIGQVKGSVIVYADKNGGFNTNATGATTSALDVLNTWATNNGWKSYPASDL